MFSNQSEKQLSEIAILRIRKVFEVFFFKEKKIENDNNNVTKKKSIKFSTTHLPCKFDFNILDIALGHMEVKT